MDRLRRGALWIAAAGVVWLAGHRLIGAATQVLADGPRAALNLRMRADEVDAWFRGAPVYEAFPGAVYPPGSMTLLWPLVGAVGPRGAVLVSIALAVVCCAALAWVFARLGAGRADLGVAVLAAASPLAVLAVSHGVALGQPHLLVLVASGGAVFLARRETLRSDVAAGLLFTLALLKPSSAAVFGWALLFAGRGRAAAVAVVGYGVATAVALAARDESAATLLSQWWFRATEGARHGAEVAGTGSVHDLVGALGIPRASVVATLVVLVLAGGFARWARHADAWLTLGVLGLCARVATYHRSYDDVLVLPAVFAGLRLAVLGQPLAGIAAGMAWLALVTPAPPWLRVLSWLVLGALLVRAVARELRDADAEPAPAAPAD